MYEAQLRRPRMCDSGDFARRLFPPSDREHVDCRDLHLALKVGDGFGAWQFMDMRQMHPYGTTNLLVEFPVIREILFDPVDVTTGQTVPGGEARMTSMNGNLTPERGWTSVRASLESRLCRWFARRPLGWN